MQKQTHIWRMVVGGVLIIPAVGHQKMSGCDRSFATA